MLKRWTEVEITFKSIFLKLNGKSIRIYIESANTLGKFDNK